MEIASIMKKSINSVSHLFFNFQLSHLETIIGDNKKGELEQNLDPCWKHGMTQYALSIYELCKSHLLVEKKRYRANMHEVVDEIEKIMPM